MNVYLIHRERTFGTDYNVNICTSRSLAKKQIEKLNKDFDNWVAMLEADMRSIGYTDYTYDQTKREKYRIEKIKLIDKIKDK